MQGWMRKRPYGSRGGLGRYHLVAGVDEEATIREQGDNMVAGVTVWLQGWMRKRPFCSRGYQLVAGVTI